MREKVLFDFSYYQKNGDFHGGGEYGNVILEQLLVRETAGMGLFFYEDSYVDKEMIDRAVRRGWNIHPIRSLRNIASLVRRFSYTTIYSPLPYDPMWKQVNLPSHVRFTGTFHGVRKIETSLYLESELEFFNEGKTISDFPYIMDSESKEIEINKYGKSLLAFMNRKIITVSEHSKYSLHYYFPQIPLSDILVLYSPQKAANFVDDIDFENTFLKSLGIMDRNFGLMVSAGALLKNSLRGVMAYDRIFEKKYSEIPDTYKVVVLGVKDKTALLKRIKHPERFILSGYIREKELETLYKHAHLFLYPTLNEGFGYPPLEAMKYGTICACSANTSIPEICGDMVLTFNPFLIDEIIVRILQSFCPQIRDGKKRLIQENLPKVQIRQREDLEKLISLLLDGECNE